MTPRVLEKLEWPLLVETLAGFCQTLPGRDRALALTPQLEKDAVLERWHDVEPLRRLVGQGYRPPIGELQALGHLLRAAGLGQILGGQELRQIATLLEATRKVHAFAGDFTARCTTLRRFHLHLYPMPQLLAAINKAIAPDGELNDDASDELQRIRKAKIAVRKRIEESLRKILHEGELLQYLQDDFFTVRNERYVVPMRLDGRGRVKGHILDTSASGQTLFIEPAAIVPINDQLQELDVEEKLEILRIFRELSTQIASDVETLTRNFDELIELDAMTGEASLAAEIDAGQIELVDEPILDLKDARHPLVGRTGADRKSPIGNAIALSGSQRTLIVSGPNAGGKTVILKTVGMLHLMAKAGLLVPAHESSRLFLFPKIWLEMGDAQNLSANLSTFSGHLLGLKPILESARSDDLVLLDELAVGTDPQTASAIGTAILEDLASRKATCLVTTHFDDLKGLAINDARFRNGSMEFSLATLKPTYKLILDIPGQSYGIEVAEHMGLPTRILSRAKELRGRQVSALDNAVSQLMTARDQARQTQQDLERERLVAQAEKARWEQEVELLRESRRKTSQSLIDKYEERIADMRREFDDLAKQMRNALKESTASQSSIERDALLNLRRRAEGKLKEMDGTVQEISATYDVGSKLPGQAATRDQLAVGLPVFVLPLKKAGTILKLGSGDEGIEVEVGIIKLRVSLHDLRILSPGEGAGSSQKPAKLKPGRHEGRTPLRPATTASSESKTTSSTTGSAGSGIGFTLQTQVNTMDLRGKDVITAIEAAWNFIDRALLRGESTIILIHGHGEGTLKQAVRDALRHNCPYDVRFRPGLEQEGGDGVTIVALK